MNWSDPDSDPVGDMKRAARVFGEAHERIGTMIVPSLVGLTHGFQRAEAEVRRIGLAWGFASVRVLWTSRPPVPFKRNKRKY